MKPTKKRIDNSNKNQKQISETSASKIDFFSSQHRNHSMMSINPKRILKLQEISNGNEDKHQENGVEALDREDGACANVEQQVDHAENVMVKGPGGDATIVACSECERYKNECEQYRKERDHFEQQYKNMKKLYVKLAVGHSELDLKHKDLQKVVSGKINEDDNNANATAGDVFTQKELKFLRCMLLDKTTDSTFVLKCLQFSYKNDISVMVNKSLFGTKESIEFDADGNEVHHPAKQPLSPHKVNRIKEEFSFRISKCNLNSVEYGERIKEAYVNKLFASGIKNISREKRNNRRFVFEVNNRP